MRINKISKEERSLPITSREIPMPEVKLPPLGIMPKYIWDIKRVENLKLAIQRYCDANQEIAIEWIKEYNELTKSSRKQR